jgi:hypothetical protein
MDVKLQVLALVQQEVKNGPCVGFSQAARGQSFHEICRPEVEFPQDAHEQWNAVVLITDTAKHVSCGFQRTSIRQPPGAAHGAFCVDREIDVHFRHGRGHSMCHFLFMPRG